VLIVLAGLTAALVREPAPLDDDEVEGQLTSTGSTASGSAPPSTSSTGSA
jgi:hypothetical protein